MNNSEKNRLERERLKIQKELYKANKLIRDQKEKERKEIELKTSVEENKKDKVSNRENAKERLFLNIPLEKLHDTSVRDDVSLSEMLGIKDNDFNTVEANEINDKEIEKNTEEKINELDRHYAPDFI